MYHSINFADVLAASTRAVWRIEDVLPEGASLDFSRNFLPETLAGTAAAEFLSADEQRVLNQIRGHEYLSIFGLVEEFILPFVLDHARPQLNGDDHRVRALLQFASEEAKHIHLFKTFHQRFTDGFGSDCQVIGPSEAIAAHILGHDPLAVALLILHIEWMSQRHYVESVRNEVSLDPLFRSLLKHHWMEEAQHAKLDAAMVESLAEDREQAEIESAVDAYLAIGGFLDGGLQAQAGLNLEALQRATGRSLPEEQRARLLQDQHQALRRTYIGSGMTHPKFVATLDAISTAGARRVAEIAPAFC